MKNGGKTPKDRLFKCEVTGKTWPLAYTIMDDDGSLIAVGGYGKENEEKTPKIRAHDEREWGF